jgi:hypothetical protein
LFFISVIKGFVRHPFFDGFLLVTAEELEDLRLFLSALSFLDNPENFLLIDS